PDEALLSSILSALHEVAPEAVVDVAHDLDEAHRIVLDDRPDLFVLDMDAAEDLGQDFLLDLRTSHPNARAIILTAVHLPSQREGIEAFNEVVSWKGGRISEVFGEETPPRTIDTDWQFLLMEAVRKVDETSALRERRKNIRPSQRHRILVIDDSLMLLGFVEE